MNKNSVIASLIFASIAFYFVDIWVDRPVSYGPGIIIPEEPGQASLREAESFKVGEYTIKPFATFSLYGRVLSKEAYYFDRGSDLAKYDLALGWKEMSDEKVLEEIDITQSGRFYWWYTADFPVPRNKIEHNSANMHLIPANEDIADKIAKARRGQVVDIEGYLVKVSAPDGWHWNSSSSRKDTGDGACELIWVEEFSILKNPFEEIESH